MFPVVSRPGCVSARFPSLGTPGLSGPPDCRTNLQLSPWNDSTSRWSFASARHASRRALYRWGLCLLVMTGFSGWAVIAHRRRLLPSYSLRCTPGQVRHPSTRSFSFILPTCRRPFPAPAPGRSIGFRRAPFWSACPGRNRRIVSEGAKAHGCLLALTASCFGVYQDFSWHNRCPTGAVRGTCGPGPKGVLLLPGRTALLTSFTTGSRR